MGWRKNKLFTAYFVSCKWCKKQFKTVPTSTKQHTCSKQCAAELQRSYRKISTCQVCGAQIASIKSRNRKFCSNKCRLSVLGKLGRETSARKSTWGEWANKRQAKRWFLEHYQLCMKCGYNSILGILELHHKDRNPKNNNKENLILLCPNCHSEEHWHKKDGQFANNRGRNAINSQRFENHGKAQRVLRKR